MSIDASKLVADIDVSAWRLVWLARLTDIAMRFMPKPLRVRVFSKFMDSLPSLIKWGVRLRSFKVRAI